MSFGQVIFLLIILLIWAGIIRSVFKEYIGDVSQKMNEDCKLIEDVFRR